MVLLVRYGELSLKSPYVRRQLEERLVTNVQEIFAANHMECVVRRERGRLFVHAEDEAAAARLLRRVFGIVSISPTKETPSDLAALTAFVVEYAQDLIAPGMTFAIRPHRSGQHPYTSQDLARVLGQAVRDGIPGVGVDLEAPDRVIHVEVRGPRAYVFHEIVEGPGGLPLGSQGEILAAIDDEAGMVAAWLLMRRGCRVRVAGREPYVAALRKWDPKLELRDRESEGELVRLAADASAIFAGPDSSDSSPENAGPLRLQPLLGWSGEDLRALADRIRGA